MTNDDEVDEEMNGEDVADEKLDTPEPKIIASSIEEDNSTSSTTQQTAPVKRKIGRRAKKVSKKDDGELEPFDLKEFFIPKDRNWVLPVYIAIVVLLFGYYMVGFMGVVDETCKEQADIGDSDCDGYVDEVDTGQNDSDDEGDGSEDNSTTEQSNGNSTGDS